MRRLWLLCLAAVLVLPAVSAAPWTQAGYDAARTGDVPDAGPAWNDTAFKVHLPGAVRAPFTGTGPEPLIVDGSAYLAIQSVSGDNDLNEQGVARVDLDTAEVDLLAETDSAPRTVAIHDDVIYVTRDGTVDAFDLGTGETVWSEDLPQQTGNSWQTICMSPAVLEDSLLVPCTEFEGPEGGPPARTVPFLAEFELETGELASLQVLDRNREASTTDADRLQDASVQHLRFVIGVSGIDRYVFATTLDLAEGGESVRPEGAWASGGVGDFRLMLWAFDGPAGELLWTDATEPRRRAEVSTWVQGISAGHEEGDRREPVAARVTGTAREIYAKLNGTVSALNPAQGNHLWSEPLGSRDARAAEGGMNSALSGSHLYATSTQSLYRFDVSQPVRDWSFSLNPNLDDDEFTWGSLIATDETVYGMTNDWSGGGALYAVDAETGTLDWRKAVRPADENRSAQFSYALGDGVIVVAGSDGSLRVIGQTEASPTPAASVSDTMPGVGEEVRVDLSGSGEGAFGPVIRYKAMWGDGTETGWQSAPLLNHTYNETGDVIARFIVSNAANQTASTTRTFDVGATEPNWLSERFEPENQEMTFGVLGIAMALGGGMIGVARRYRKRANLEKELEALEEGFEETKDKPGECEAFLDNRKGRARSLALDGHLTEEQVPVIENRAEELRGQLRTSMLDERFQFLPHGMVQSLKRMLGDGQINAWERDTIETLLEEDEALNAAQKERVRGLLERWSDAGSGTGEEGTRT